jgi:hypothetical protein
MFAGTATEDGPLTYQLRPELGKSPVETGFRAPVLAYSSAIVFVYVHVQCTVLSYKSCLMY